MAFTALSCDEICLEPVQGTNLARIQGTDILVTIAYEPVSDSGFNTRPDDGRRWCYISLDHTWLRHWTDIAFDEMLAIALELIRSYVPLSPQSYVDQKVDELCVHLQRRLVVPEAVSRILVAVLWINYVRYQECQTIPFGDGATKVRPERRHEPTNTGKRYSLQIKHR